MPYSSTEIADTAFAECSNLRDIDLNEHCTRQQMLDVQEIVDAQGLKGLSSCG